MASTSRSALSATNLSKFKPQKTDQNGKAVHEECYVQSLKADPAKPAAAD
jgi:hypothetical protein